MKNKILVAVAALGLMVGGAGLMMGAAAAKVGKPKSVLHIVTVRWKAEATPEAKAAALAGVEKMAAAIPGVKNVWLDTLKVQGDNYNNVIVMEFADQKAFAAYADHSAHKDWEKIYLPIRDQSTTHDATNK